MITSLIHNFMALNKVVPDEEEPIALTRMVNYGTATELAHQVLALRYNSHKINQAIFCELVSEEFLNRIEDRLKNDEELKKEINSLYSKADSVHYGDKHD